MYREQILKNMDKIFYKLEIYDKKKQLMGLDNEEQERFCSLFVDYLELKMRLWDSVFNEYILHEVMDCEAKKIYEDLHKTIKWNCDLLISQQEMDSIKNEFNNCGDINKVIVDIFHLYKILKDNLLRFKEENIDPDFFEEISLLLSNDKNKDFSVISDFLKFKFDTLCIALGIKEETK